MICNDDPLSHGIVLRPTSPTHHLQNILRTELNPLSLLGAVYLSAFNDNCVGWEVDTPGQSRSRDQDLDVPGCEEIFN